MVFSSCNWVITPWGQIIKIITDNIDGTRDVLWLKVEIGRKIWIRQELSDRDRCVWGLYRTEGAKVQPYTVLQG